MHFLNGDEFKDANDNQYPQIYTKAINPNSSEALFQQVNRVFSSRIERGFGPVQLSAYLEKFVSRRTTYLRNIQTEKIMRSLEKCENIAADGYDIVLLWDIADITMLGKNHIDELDELSPEIKSKSLYNLQKNICNSVNFSSLEMAELYEIVGNVENIEDAFTGETEVMKKAVPIYNALRELYNGVQQHGSREKGEIISHDLLEKLGIIDQKSELCQTANEHQKVFNQRWKCAKRCMELVNKRSAKSKTKKYANVVLCEQGVACGAAQMLIAGSSSHIEVENLFSIYPNPPEKSSCWHAMKSVRERIQKRFGEKCCLIHVSSGAFYVDIPMERWTITANESFKFLFTFLKDVLE